MNPPHGPGYSVTMSEQVRDILRAAHDRAAAGGRKAEFMAALRAIDHRLRTDAADFGEERFDLRYANLTVKIGVIRPVAVIFAVNLAERAVFLRLIVYLPPS